MTLEQLTSIASIVSVFMLAWVAWRKTPVEREGIISATDATYQELYLKGAERISVLEKERQELKDEVYRLTVWAKLLISKLEEIGITDIPLKPNGKE